MNLMKDVCLCVYINWFWFTGYPLCHLSPDVRQLLLSLVQSCSDEDVAAFVTHASFEALKDTSRGKT